MSKKGKRANLNMQRSYPTVTQLDRTIDRSNGLIEQVRIEEHERTIAYVNALTVPVLRLMQLIEWSRTAIRCAIDLESELDGMPGQLAGALLELIRAYDLVDESLAQRNPKLLTFTEQLIEGIAGYLKAAQRSETAATQSREALRTLTARRDDPITPFAQDPSGMSGSEVIGTWLLSYEESPSVSRPEAARMLLKDLRTLDRDKQPMTIGQKEARRLLEADLTGEADTIRKRLERYVKKYKGRKR